jgi:hypothetical protein
MIHDEAQDLTYIRYLFAYFILEVFDAYYSVNVFHTSLNA